MERISKMMMEDDIIELHRALQEARGLDNRSERYKMQYGKGTGY